MTDARERLTRLIELASENAPEKQPALAFELCDLLVAWPERYPQIMREPFEALLEKVLRRLDETTRRLIATRLSGHSETAVALLNEFYFDVPTPARSVILERNHEPADEASQSADVEGEARLVEAVRRMGPVEFAATFAGFLRVSPATARSILDDATGDALAVACKGADATRDLFRARSLRDPRLRCRTPDALCPPYRVRRRSRKRRRPDACALAPGKRRPRGVSTTLNAIAKTRRRRRSNAQAC